MRPRCLPGVDRCSKTGNAAATENPSIPSSLPLSHAGRWITDAQGRVVVIHGMNYVKKTQTKLADGTLTLDPAADGFGDNDLQWLQDNGFNGLRLGVEDYGVEPQPGVYDDVYIGQLVAIAKAAAAHNVHTLVDFHQDDFGPAFNGNGFPAWMAQDDGLPHQPDPGFPYNQFVEPALLRAWDHFWANDPASDNIGLQDHFAAAAARVAGQFAGIDALLGFEYLNEPWPGTPYATCLVPVAGCPLFDSTLNAFNQRVAPAIRAVDRRHLIFAEPNVLFNDGIPTNIGALQDGNAGFAFHVYCLLAGADSDTEDPGGAQLCTFGEGDSAASYCFYVDVDPANCGACGRRCPTPPDGATAACNGGRCIIECAPGLADCDDDPRTGCETSTDADPNNCGGCGVKCDIAAGQPCIRGQCALAPCPEQQVK